MDHARYFIADPKEQPSGEYYLLLQPVEDGDVCIYRGDYIRYDPDSRTYLLSALINVGMPEEAFITVVEWPAHMKFQWVHSTYVQRKEIVDVWESQLDLETQRVQFECAANHHLGRVRENMDTQGE